MKPTPAQLSRALAAAFDLKDNGPGEGRFPVSFTKNPELYVQVIAEAVLADVPEPVGGSWWGGRSPRADGKPRVRWVYQ